MSQSFIKKEQITGSTVNCKTLIDLRQYVLHNPNLSYKKKLFLPGQNITSLRGCGIEFDTTREYQAGDDIRNMAWRVTARTLKSHVKVYREEKERPVWLALDLSPSMYFGTRVMFKSVKSIMQAALTGWTSLLKDERVGAIIHTGQKPLLFQPKLNETYYLSILNSLAASSILKPVFDEQQYLYSLLSSLQQYVRSGHLIYIFSDFMSFHSDSERLLLFLAQRAQIFLNFIYDPFEASPPPPYHYMLTNGQQKLLFNMQDSKNRENYRQLFLNKLKQLKTFADKHNIILHLHCTDPTREEKICH